MRKEGSQMEMDFETIHAARCFDGTAPEGREITRQDLVSSGDERFVNSEGDVYERAIRKDNDQEDGYVLVEKKNVPESILIEMERLKERWPDRTWLDLYQMARISLERRRGKGAPKSEPLDQMLR